MIVVYKSVCVRVRVCVWEGVREGRTVLACVLCAHPGRNDSECYTVRQPMPAVAAIDTGTMYDTESLQPELFGPQAIR